MKKGFTLIEMVVVIIIVAVMASVLVPAYSRFYAHARFDGNVRDVQDVFAYAREQALAKDAPATLTFDPQSESFAVNLTPPPPPTDQPSSFPDASADSSTLPQTHLVQLDPIVAVTNFSASDTSQGTASATPSQGRGSTVVRFRPDGTSDSAEMTVLSAEAGYSAHLILHPGNGRLTLDDDTPGAMRR